MMACSPVDVCQRLEAAASTYSKVIQASAFHVEHEGGFPPFDKQSCKICVVLIFAFICLRQYVMRLVCGWVIGSQPGLRCCLRTWFANVVTRVAIVTVFISVINQLDARNFCFTIRLFHASTCFEHMWSTSGGQNCITQPLVSSHV